MWADATIFLLACILWDKSASTCLPNFNGVHVYVSACFGVHVRGSEYIPMLGSSAEPDYAFFGGADYD
jgi:hypothetical protein